MAGAARTVGGAVAVARVVRFTLDDDAVAVVAVDHEGEEHGEEEEDTVPLVDLSVPGYFSRVPTTARARLT